MELLSLLAMFVVRYHFKHISPISATLVWPCWFTRVSSSSDDSFQKKRVFDARVMSPVSRIGAKIYGRKQFDRVLTPSMWLPGSPLLTRRWFVSCPSRNTLHAKSVWRWWFTTFIVKVYGSKRSRQWCKTDDKEHRYLASLTCYPTTCGLCVVSSGMVFMQRLTIA